MQFFCVDCEGESLTFPWVQANHWNQEYRWVLQTSKTLLSKTDTQSCWLHRVVSQIKEQFVDPKVERGLRRISPSPTGPGFPGKPAGPGRPTPLPQCTAHHEQPNTEMSAASPSRRQRIQSVFLTECQAIHEGREDQAQQPS
jgi:hypothetical protein